MNKYEHIIQENPAWEYIACNNEDGTVSVIPMVEGNSDYQRYLRWLENPNEVKHLTEISTASEA